MRRFNQRSVIPSNLRLDEPEKVRRLEPAWIKGLSNLLTSSNLSPRTPVRSVHTCARIRARKCQCLIRLGEVRRLDKARRGKGLRASNLPSNVLEVGRMFCQQKGKPCNR